MLKPFILAIIVGSALVAALYGCSGGDNKSSTKDSAAMIVGQEYQVHKYNRVVTTSAEPAKIAIRHEAKGDARYITLVSGSADLFR